MQWCELCTPVRLQQNVSKSSNTHRANMFALVYCKYTTYFTNDAACATALRAVCNSKPYVEKKEGIKQNQKKNTIYETRSNDES